MTCKGICIRYKADSNNYANGQKRCQICDLFMQWDGIFCPCCGYKLRNRPRNFSNTKLREQKRIRETTEAKILYHVQTP
jgi:hypothetical protein